MKLINEARQIWHSALNEDSSDLVFEIDPDTLALMRKENSYNHYLNSHSDGKLTLFGVPVSIVYIMSRPTEMMGSEIVGGEIIRNDVCLRIRYIRRDNMRYEYIVAPSSHEIHNRIRKITNEIST